MGAGGGPGSARRSSAIRATATASGSAVAATAPPVRAATAPAASPRQGRPRQAAGGVHASGSISRGGLPGPMIQTCPRGAMTQARTGPVCPAASAWNRLMPTAGMPRPIASPRAAATAMRTPVKLPGPMPAPIAARSRQPAPVSASNAAHSGSSRSAWPCAIASCRAASTRRPETSAAAQCAADVSKPSPIGSACNRANLGHFGDVVSEQVLDPHLQRQGR